VTIDYSDLQRTLAPTAFLRPRGRSLPRGCGKVVVSTDIGASAETRDGSHYQMETLPVISTEIYAIYSGKPTDNSEK
jgi:hypothetical protein